MSRAVVALALAAVVAGASLGATLASVAPARETHALLLANATGSGAFRLAMDYTLREACFAFASADPERSDDLLVTGSGNVFHGCVESNGDVRVGGSDHRFDGEVRHVDDYTQGGNGHELRLGHVAVDPTEDPWSRSFSRFEPGARDPMPDYHYHESDATLEGDDLLPGTHYVYGDVVVRANGRTLAITVVATGNVTVYASTANLSASEARVLFASRYGNLSVEGSAATLEGLVKAPHGHVALLVSGTTMEAHVAGRTLAVSGSNNELTPLRVDAR